MARLRRHPVAVAARHDVVLVQHRDGDTALTAALVAVVRVVRPEGRDEFLLHPNIPH